MKRMPVASWIAALAAFLTPAVIPPVAEAQLVTRLVVDMTTRDTLFAGTDDGIVLFIGGMSFELDDPNRDDFERGHTDRFELPIPDPGLDLATIRIVGTIAVIKTGDSFFGGGWNFGGITIWPQSASLPPIYQNASVNKWLDGGDLEWHTTLGEPGWNIPEPPPFPPCVSGDVDTGTVVDSDCDGVPDGSDPTFDNPPDQDGDGLPDLYEDITGTNPLDDDSDDDGWADGRNRRVLLILDRIECIDENEDVGSDEIFLVAMDVRHPRKVSLDGYWAMDDNSIVFPGMIVDSRLVPRETPGSPPLAFKTHMRLRESDFEFFESPTDDTYRIFDVLWSSTGTQTVEHNADDAHYLLTFRAVETFAQDPSPNDPNADSDKDGLRDSTEFQLSTQQPSVQVARVEGYDGLADPSRRDLFVEIDFVTTARMPFDAKQAVASQFDNQGIRPRFDDGYFGGGGEVIADGQSVVRIEDLENTYRPQHSASVRTGEYRYGLFSEETAGEGSSGNARGTGFIVARETMLGEFSAIVLMHEIGHTLDLCHPGGDGKPPEVSATCPTPPSWPHANCRHYCGVGDNDITAMGADIGLDSILAGVAAGALIGGLLGAAGGPAGVVAGIIIGGLLGGILGFVNSDAYLRVVNYHLNEWAALRFF